jgi:hypothetical protein
MGWRGTLRSIAAASRRAEREAQSRHRQLLAQQKQLNRMAELERASYEVDLYRARMDALLSVHKDASDDWDWHSIRASGPPEPPQRLDDSERAARDLQVKYVPSLTDKILGRTERKHKDLAASVEAAKLEDSQRYQQALDQNKLDVSEWQRLQSLAEGVLNGDLTAYETVIRETNPFSEIGDLGSSVSFTIDNSRIIEVNLDVNSEAVIPPEEKILLQSGKLSTKKIPKSKFYEIYQDYVASCLLRVARELFALLPVEMVVAHAVGEVLNSATGHLEKQPILSVAIPAKTLRSFKFDSIDCSDSLSNFVHRMKFSRTKGFSPIDPINPADLRPAEES